jgi:hypothetical protein
MHMPCMRLPYMAHALQTNIAEKRSDIGEKKFCRKKICLRSVGHGVADIAAYITWGHVCLICIHSVPEHRLDELRGD